MKEKHLHDKTNWNMVINQPDEISTTKEKSDPDAPILEKYKYNKSAKIKN